jgi:hypothetical protein
MSVNRPSSRVPHRVVPRIDVNALVDELDDPGSHFVQMNLGVALDDHRVADSASRLALVLKILSDGVVSRDGVRVIEDTLTVKLISCKTVYRTDCRCFFGDGGVNGP